MTEATAVEERKRCPVLRRRLSQGARAQKPALHPHRPPGAHGAARPHGPHTARVIHRVVCARNQALEFALQRKQRDHQTLSVYLSILSPLPLLPVRIHQCQSWVFPIYLPPPVPSCLSAPQLHPLLSSLCSGTLTPLTVCPMVRAPLTGPSARAPAPALLHDTLSPELLLPLAPHLAFHPAHIPETIFPRNPPGALNECLFCSPQDPAVTTENGAKTQWAG